MLCGRRTPLPLLNAPALPPLPSHPTSTLRPPTTLPPLLPHPTGYRPATPLVPTPSLPHPLRQALSEAEKEKFMYPCDPWETCTPQLFDDTAAAAPAAPAATAGLSVAAASAAATAGLSTPAPVLAPVLQGVNGPSAQEQGSLEYRIKLKEYEVRLQQLRILRSLSLSLSCRTRRRRLQPSARPRREPRVVHAVYAVPISTYVSTCLGPTPSTCQRDQLN